MYRLVCKNITTIHCSSQLMSLSLLLCFPQLVGLPLLPSPLRACIHCHTAIQVYRCTILCTLLCATTNKPRNFSLTYYTVFSNNNVSSVSVVAWLVILQDCMEIKIFIQRYIVVMYKSQPSLPLSLQVLHHLPCTSSHHQ